MQLIAGPATQQPGLQERKAAAESSSDADDDSDSPKMGPSSDAEPAGNIAPPPASPGQAAATSEQSEQDSGEEGSEFKSAKESLPGQTPETEGSGEGAAAAAKVENGASNSDVSDDDSDDDSDNDVQLAQAQVADKAVTAKKEETVTVMAETITSERSASESSDESGTFSLWYHITSTHVLHRSRVKAAARQKLPCLTQCTTPTRHTLA